MTFAILMAAVTIAVPKPGARLPPVDRCYSIGAVSRGVTNLVVQGRDVAIYRTGAWATMLDVVPGTNTVEVIAGGEVTNLVFFVAPKPPPKPAVPAATNAPPAKVYAKLDYAKDEARTHPRGKRREEIVIALDPGHGGTDVGALSPHGYFEKEANLLVAREVRRALEKRGLRVLMTREDDRAIELTERPRAAHEQGADAFVSIHHNAPAADRDPRAIRYTAAYAWNPLGEALAKAVDVRLGKALEGDIRNNGVLRANFAVTRSPEVPSCLVEVDFLVSPEGEEAVWNHVRRRRIAEAIADGIVDWAEPAKEEGESE